MEDKWWNWVAIAALISLLLIVVPLSIPAKKSRAEMKLMYDEYLKQFNKSYSTPEEYEARFNHFVESLSEIELLNTGSGGPDHLRAKFGLTKLSDMSKTEFREIHLSDEKMTRHPRQYCRSWEDGGNRSRSRRHGDCEETQPSDKDVYYVVSRKKRAALPLQMDWRTKGVISPIRNQGLCGACWAFSTVATIETMNAIKTGKLDLLSVQEAIDCAGLGNSGCAGGDICLLLDWLSLTDTAIEKETAYPLKLMNGACKASTTPTGGVKISTFTCDEFVGKEDKILEAIATHGPVTVAVNALTWQNYLGGVIQYHCSGSAIDLNHAVQLVGYDLTAEVPYYIAKNSWGKDFGNAGYLNLAIGSNICGLANEVATVDIK